MEAWCIKCKTKREIDHPQASFASNGTPITKGTCSVCGSKLSVFGMTEAHKELEPPVVEKKVRIGKSKTVSKTSEKSSQVKTKTGSSKKTASNVGEKSATPVKKTTSKSAAKKTNKSAVIQPSQSLVIVESPAKARTIGRFLGSKYVVRASVGHVRDLLKSTLSVDVENNFEPKYRVPNEKRELVKELTALSEGAKKVYLATDPDREGEAIAWHLTQAAQIAPEKTDRVVFHEITQTAVDDAFAHPGQINMDLVDAQQARRVLDRLVGYKLSPWLWEKVSAHLSAGRVQSVAVRLIVDREREIQNFDPREYWTVNGEFLQDGLKETFLLRLVKINQKDPDLSTKEVVDGHLSLLEKSSFVIKTIKKSVRKRRPYPPFTTSTLQQEASKRLGFTSKRTMVLAQQLYEGIALGTDGTVGLITYMRTDSANIAEAAQKEAQTYIHKRFGDKFTPKNPPIYHTKTKGAQEAHEAVRPTSVNRTPDKIKEFLGRDQLRLYQLIWNRFLASQMEDAIYETMTIDVEGKNQNDYLFRSSGSKNLFLGFLILYEDTKDEDPKDDKLENTIFPEGLAEGKTQQLKRLIPEQHFTQPPPRYTEATLVKTMEENGIGRPSTYASIISTIQARGYVALEKRRFYPTEIGFIVNDLLVENFSSIVDVGFTSLFESDLDQVAEGQKEWREVVGEFYQTFRPALEKAEAITPVTMTKKEPEKIGRACPQCGKALVIRVGRFGKFISCSGFPKCHYTEPIVDSTGITCPDCGQGEIIKRRTRKGRTFYGCSRYPDCQFTSWKEPVKDKCPECGGLMVITARNKVQCINCKKQIILNPEPEKESAD